MKRGSVATAFGLGFACAAAWPATGAERPAAQLVAACASCHRLDNRPTGIPPIVGLGASQIVAMLQGFKSRPQSSHIMHAIGRSLSDEEIVAIASYLAALGQEVRDR